MKSIHLSRWTLELTQGRVKIKRISEDVVVSGENVSEIIKNEYYFRRAVRQIASNPDFEKYKAIKVELIKRIS